MPHLADLYSPGSEAHGDVQTVVYAPIPAARFVAVADLIGGVTEM